MKAYRKMIAFRGNEKQVQSLANQNFDGNFTQALNFLHEVGLAFWTDEQVEAFKLEESNKKLNPVIDDGWILVSEGLPTSNGDIEIYPPFHDGLKKDLDCEFFQKEKKFMVEKSHGYKAVYTEVKNVEKWRYKYRTQS